MRSTARHRQRCLESAKGYLMLSMPDHALEQLEQISDPGPAEFDWLLMQGEAHREKSQFAKALEFYELAVQRQPTHVEVLMGLAWCYKRTDQLSRSIETMHQARRAHPKEPILVYNLACYYALAGDDTQTLAWLARALRMDGDLRKLIPRETDFDRLRDDPRFVELLNMVDPQA